MFLIRVLAFVIVFTTIGLVVLFSPPIKTTGEGIYAFYQGNLAYKHGDFQAAEEDYQKALHGYPNVSDVYLKLGDVQNQLSHPKSAILLYQQALHMDPNSKTALMKLAKAEWTENHHEIALNLYENALKQTPDDETLKTEMGNDYLTLAQETNSTQDYQKAAIFFKAFVAKDKDNDDAQYKLAESFFGAGQYDDALQTYCELAKKHPQDPDTLYSLAATFAKENAYQEAYTYMAKATELISINHPELSQQWANQALSFQEAQSSPMESTPGTVTNCVSALKASEAEKEHRNDSENTH